MLLLAALPHAKHVSQTVSSCCKFFFDKDKLQDCSSIQWWHVVSHKPHASKPWRLGNPESTCQVRHCTTQSTALVLQLHKVAAGRDSKLALRSCMLKPKLILSNRSHVIQHNQWLGHMLQDPRASNNMILKARCSSVALACLGYVFENFLMNHIFACVLKWLGEKVKNSNFCWKWTEFRISPG